MTKKTKKKATKKVSSPSATENPLLGSILGTMHGDLVKSMLEELKSTEAENIWLKLPQSKQDTVIDRINRKSENIIRQMFALVAQRGYEHATATVTKVTFDKSVAKIAMESRKNAGAHEMADRTNEAVMVLFVDPEEYLNGKNMPESEKDQKEIPLADNKDNK